MKRIPPYFRMDTEAFLFASEQKPRKSMAIFDEFRKILFRILNDEPNDFDETTAEGRMLKRFEDTAKAGLDTYWKHINALPSNDDTKGKPYGKPYGKPNGEPDGNIIEQEQKNKRKEEETDNRAEVTYGNRI